MPRTRPQAVARVALMVVLAVPGPALAQRVPLTRFYDELTQTQVSALLLDSAGFLWIGTFEGLSRYDGYEFRNYPPSEGLGHPIVNDVAEGPDGTLWAATNGAGVARLVDARASDGGAAATVTGVSRPRRFVNHLLGESVQVNAVNALAFDAAGHLWCATDDGVYRSAGESGAPEPTFSEVPGTKGFAFRDLARSPTGMILLGFERTRLSSGRLFIAASGDRASVIAEWTDDRSDRLLVTEDGVVVSRGGRLVRYAVSDGRATPTSDVRLPLDSAHWISTLAAGGGDALWVGTTAGLFRWTPGSLRRVGESQGLGTSPITALARQPDGTLWIGTSDSGLFRLATSPILTWTETEGLPEGEVLQTAESRDGRVYGTTRSRVVEVAPTGGISVLPGSSAPQFQRVSLRPSDDGTWWAATARGVYRLAGPRPDFARPLAFHPASAFTEGPLYLGGPDTPSPFIDSRGRVWVGTMSGLYRLDPASRGSFERAAAPARRTRIAGETPGEVFWLVGNTALGRLVSGVAGLLDPSPGLPETSPRSLLVDHRGWVWVGLRHGGVSVTRDPASRSPAFQNYNTGTGLSSNVVWSIAEDKRGVIYLGTERGVDRLDPETGRVRRFSTRDGLAGNRVRHLFRDSRGFIWVATTEGLSRLDPSEPEAPGAATRVVVSRLQMGGEDVRLPERGVRRLDGLELPLSRNTVVVEYGAPNLSGQPLNYQYRLAGVDADWGTPTARRAVDYARLAPGHYRLLVRAVAWDGTASSEPAEIAFRIVPPFWRRSWFLALAVVLAMAGGLSLHRLRLRQALALERVRRQIATDLHDDLGAALSQVAILSEVARRTGPEAERHRALEKVGDIARSMRQSMSDIVWSVDSRNDRLFELVVRVREVATNTLEARGITVEYDLPPAARQEAVVLTPDRRRQLLLFWKEALTNIARHASASHVEMSVRLASGGLSLTIADDGVGFDRAGARAGHGLISLEERIRRLGGRLEIRTSAGQGTRIEASVPLA